MKDTAKTNKLLEILIFLMLTFVLIVTFGILTRKDPEPVQFAAYCPVEDSQNAGVAAAVDRLADAILKVEQKLIEIYENEKVEQEAAKPKKHEYDYYIDEITVIHYPKLDAKYIRAIIWHESRYDADAVNSETGVKGLMQISPKWHTKRAERLGVTDLFDPFGNILVGCDILNELTDKYDFNYALNFFAGGYPYADRYRNSKSPFVSQIEQIIQDMDDGTIVVGGE